MEEQIGREATPREYISRLTEVFTEVRRVLRSDGTLWLNIADTYAGKGNQGDFDDPMNPKGRNGQAVALNYKAPGCKPKDMIGIPWMLAFALRDSGWYLRNDIIWMKENPMPESCKDRCSRCYEHIFLLSKSRKYFFDAKAISEPIAPSTAERLKRGMKGGSRYGKPVPGQPQTQTINRPREHGEITDSMINPMRNNTFYIVIDYDAPINEEEEQYQTYFLNMVDESDLLALMDEDSVAALTTCTCTDKCEAGRVNTSCPVCKTNMSECTGTAPEPEAPAEEPEPVVDEKPQKNSNMGMIIVIIAVAGIGGAGYYYIKFVRGKKQKDEDMDFFDDEGYEEEPYINEDEEPQIASDDEPEDDEK